MPTYKNTNNLVVTMGSLRLEPGESKETELFIKTLPSGIVQTVAIPYFDNILHSEKITSTKTVAVPTALEGNYIIKIFCTAGEISVKLNNTAATAKLLGVGMEMGILCLTRIVDQVIFTVSSGTAYISIEKA